MTENTTLSDEDAIRRFDAAKKRREAADTRRVEVNTRLKQKQYEAEQLKAKAREAYGSDDPEVLEKEIQSRREQNTRTVVAFEEGVVNLEEEIEHLEELLRP